MLDLRGLTLDECRRLMGQLGQPPYRGEQVFRWLHQHQTTGVEAMINLPRALRQSLEEMACVTNLRLLDRREADQGQTLKLLLGLPDGATVEAVLMLYHGRRQRERQTVCLSSQVGCPMSCAFCATGAAGFERNLTAGEILAQVAALCYQLPAGRRISNVVFMGMGEPLLNFAAVVKAVAILTDPAGYAISPRRVTLSTCGLVPRVDDLAQLGLGVNLAVSLHAPTNDLRDQLVPLNRRYPLEELLAACRRYVAASGRRLTFEYTLLAGVNDSDRQALQLADLVAGLPCYLNLIPLNRAAGSSLRRPTPGRIKAFADLLEERGVKAVVREERGGTVAAACGQLRQRQELGQS